MTRFDGDNPDIRQTDRAPSSGRAHLHSNCDEKTRMPTSTSAGR
ncbi:hypothetical protein [Lyngbya sp. CCY1209]|nr:hypothetical protein [Lyngbya sp. CCY1209]